MASKKYAATNNLVRVTVTDPDGKSDAREYVRNRAAIERINAVCREAVSGGYTDDVLIDGDRPETLVEFKMVRPGTDAGYHVTYQTLY